MSKQTKRSIIELVAIAAFATVAVIQTGLAAGLGLTVAAVFVYGVVSVLTKFKRVKAMAVSGASRLASTD